MLIRESGAVVVDDLARPPKPGSRDSGLQISASGYVVGYGVECCNGAIAVIEVNVAGVTCVCRSRDDITTRRGRSRRSRPVMSPQNT